MGSQNSKFGHESMTSSNRRENAFGLITSNSKSGMDVRNRQNSGLNSFKDTNLVNTSFKWTHGGNSVFLTGTFTGWTDHYPLQKIGNEFTGILRLPRGEYYYKFIVDGEWKFSPSDPTKRDEMGNTNNYLNTTNIESMNKMMESNSQVRKSEFSDSKTTIESNQLIEDAPVLPAHLKGIYFLNEKDRKKEEDDEYFDREVDPAEFEIDKYINFEAKSARKEFISNKNVLAPPTHVTLNHLGIYGGGPTNDNNYCVTTMTQRFKSKYATIKFHSSKFTQIH